MRTTLSRSLLLLGVLAAAAHAGTPIEQSRPVDADARIDIANVKGSVKVSGWDKAEVAISGTLGDGAKGLSVDGGKDHLTIRVEAPDKQGWFSWGADSRMGDSDLIVKVPNGAELKIEVVSADVVVEGVGGRSLNVDSVSGKLHLESTAKELELDSVSGNIDIAGAAGHGHLETVSGNIHARGLGGQIKFETVSGDIDADNGTYTDLNAGTVSGNINLRGTPGKAARVEVETMSGDLHLALPADVSARLRASSFSGSIRSDFGSAKKEDHGPGSRLDVSNGAGEGQVKIETFSGDIEIRKQ